MSAKALILDLELVTNLLTNAEIPDSPSETVDSHFDQIAHLIEQEEVEEAAELIEKSFSKGTPDIRIIFYYHYAYFCHFGTESLITSLPSIASMVNNHWEVLRPTHRKENHFQSSVNWFFLHLLNKLKYCEKLHRAGKAHPIWEKSFSTISLEKIEAICASINTFQQFFSEKWPKSTTRDRIFHLGKKMEEIKSLVEQEAMAKTEVEEVVTEESKNLSAEEAIQEEIVESPQEEHLNLEESQEDHLNLGRSQDDLLDLYDTFEEEIPFAEPSLDLISETENEELPFEEDASSHLTKISEKKTSQNQIEGQELFLERLKEFSHKMTIFEEFIQQNNYLKAAIVARDIDDLLENFDPLSFFPKLFGKYFSLFAKHVAALSEQYEKKDSLQIQKLEKLYQADLDMFVEW